MSLRDAIERFRDLDEANIPAPAVSRTTAGEKQISAKSRFTHVSGADRDYTRAPASIPADPEAKAAAERSTAGVKGPIGADGREQVDVRYEEKLRREKGRGVGIDDFSEQEDVDDLEFAEAMLNDTLGRRGPSQQEANIRAPKAGRKNAGGSQISPKSKFAREYYPGPGNKPADPEAMAAAERSTAGVSGPGYAPDGREEVDVRQESVDSRNRAEIDAFDPENQEYPEELIQR
jgi:hypothetical protein